MKRKPTKEECHIIRDCAKRSAGYRRVELCPGERVNLTDGRRHFNIALISEHPDLDETDLFSNSWKWRDFTNGVELTADGCGIFDFYVYGPLGHHKELQTNVKAYYQHGKLVRVDGTCDGVMWPPKIRGSK
jgi:hypothetical protein